MHGVILRGGWLIDTHLRLPKWPYDSSVVAIMAIPMTA
jgi:hypothetical protein